MFTFIRDLKIRNEQLFYFGLICLGLAWCTKVKQHANQAISNGKNVRRAQVVFVLHAWIAVLAPR